MLDVWHWLIECMLFVCCLLLRHRAFGRQNDAVGHKELMPRDWACNNLSCCLSSLNLQIHRRSSQTMATRQKAVYTNILFSAMHLFTRLSWPINFARKLRPHFLLCPACLSLPKWVASTYLWKLFVIWSCEKSSNLLRQRVALLSCESWIISIAGPACQGLRDKIRQMPCQYKPKPSTLVKLKVYPSQSYTLYCSKVPNVL